MKESWLRRLLAAAAFFVLGVGVVRLTSPAQVTVTWETASEVDAAGFHLYRSTEPTGPFERVTEELIPARGDPLVGEEYEYEDQGLTWGRRYYYELEEVGLNGTTNRYPEQVIARAGLGWTWAVAAGALLAAVAGFSDILARQPEEEEAELSPEVT
jgi:hypothetical protein